MAAFARRQAEAFGAGVDAWNRGEIIDAVERDGRRKLVPHVSLGKEERNSLGKAISPAFELVWSLIRGIRQTSRTEIERAKREVAAIRKRADQEVAEMNGNIIRARQQLDAERTKLNAERRNVAQQRKEAQSAYTELISLAHALSSMDVAISSSVKQMIAQNAGLAAREIDRSIKRTVHDGIDFD